MDLRDEVLRTQRTMTDVVSALRHLTKVRDQQILQLHQSGMSPREIAKFLGINHSPVYKILARAGYTPKYSFKQSKLRNDTQRVIVETARAKMAAKAKPKDGEQG